MDSLPGLSSATWLSLNSRALMSSMREASCRLAIEMTEVHPEDVLWSASHSMVSIWVRRLAQARRNGTKTAESVQPMGGAGGLHDLRHGERDPMTARGEGEDRGSGRAPGVAPGADHSRVNGPEGDGMDMTVPLAVALVGRIEASSMKISRCILGGGPINSRHRFAEPDMTSSWARCTAVRRLERRRREDKISESGPPEATTSCLDSPLFSLTVELTRPSILKETLRPTW